MTNPLDRQPHDLALIRKPPLNKADLRVPLAEEETLDSQIQVHNAARSRRSVGWHQFPTLSFSQTRKLSIGAGKALIPIYPGELEISTSLTLPALANATDTIKRNDFLTLVAFAAEVGAAQDPVLGQLTYQGQYEGTTEIVSVTKENSRRWRAFWVLILSQVPLTIEAFMTPMPLVGTLRSFNVSDTSETGFLLGSQLRVFARDSHLAQANYLLFPDTIQFLELCRLRRWQNQLERGYIYGNGGEGVLDVSYHVTSAAPRLSNRGIETDMRLRLRQLFSGKPGISNAYTRSVQNLLASSVGSNPGFPGESAGSPNGSVALANGQRIAYTNQAIIERIGCWIVSATNNGTGSPVISINLNSAPLGSYFSGDRADHKIYSFDGVEQSDRGTFSGLGTTGLIWEGDANSTIQPGQTVYVQPGVFYPGGSGLPIPFETVERAWRNSSTEISPSNIRAADHADLEAYEAPANSESLILITGRERAAIHRLYRKISVAANASGLLVIPPDARGCFAFIQGVAGRINAPIKTGLTPNTTYNALIYDPFLPTDAPQFLLKYAEYQGTGAVEPSWLSGAVVVTQPLLFIHTQGGGSAVHQGDADTRLTPIAMHLPAVTNESVPAYRFNSRCQLSGEPRQGPITLRPLPLLPAPSLALPSPGQTLSLLSASINHARSLKTKLLGDGKILGFRTPQLASRGEFQAVVAFVAEKAGDRRLVVMARNTIGAENVVADTDQQTAIDTFQL